MACRKTIIAVALVLSAIICVQSFSGQLQQTPLQKRGIIKSPTSRAAKSDSDETKTTSKGGAGSWRAKAKEFCKEGSVNASDMKLNIAFVTGNAMKQKEINLILSQHGGATAGTDGESYVNLRILDVDLPEIQGKIIGHVFSNLDHHALMRTSIGLPFKLSSRRNKHR